MFFWWCCLLGSSGRNSIARMEGRPNPVPEHRISLGYEDSNLEQLDQKQPCCQLHHTPWGYQCDRAAIVLTTTWFLQNRHRTLHARRWGIQNGPLLIGSAR